MAGSEVDEPKSWFTSSDTRWNVAVVDAPIVGVPSRTEFDILQRLVETLSMRLDVQSKTIDILSARIGQAQKDVADHVVQSETIDTLIARIDALQNRLFVLGL